jgi:ComEC/Rec2-related protein
MFRNHNLPPLVSITLALMAGICGAHGSVHCWWLFICSLLLTHNLRDRLFVLLACAIGANLPISPRTRHAARPVCEQLANTCSAQLTPRTGQLFATIFLGKPAHNTHESRELFSYWGIAHQLARSGLHLVILLMMLRWALGFVPLWYGIKLVITLLLVGAYGYLSWPSISFIRACITCFVYALYELLLIPVSPVQVVTLVTFIVLAQNPGELFFLDFQLSFGLTFALAFVGHVKRASP